MFNRIKKIFKKNRNKKEDKGSLTESEESVAVTPDEEQKALMRLILGLPKVPKKRSETFASSSSSSAHSFDNPVYEPEPPPPLEIVKTDAGTFGKGEYTYSRNFTEDLEFFTANGIIIDSNEKIGRGSSGALIYKGYYRNISEEINDKQFAVKVFIYLPRDQVEKEKAMMNIIEHKYLVNVHYIFNMGDIHTEGYIGDRVYIFMDFGDFGSIAKYFEANPKFNSNELRAMTYQLFEGLRYLHQMGIRHGDVHLGNVLLCSLIDEIDFNTLSDNNSALGRITVHFTAKLADFGLSERDNWFSNDLHSLGLYIFEVMADHYCEFDNEKEKAVFYSLSKRMKSMDCTNIQYIYQSIEFRKWFKIG